MKITHILGMCLVLAAALSGNACTMISARETPVVRVVRKYAPVVVNIRTENVVDLREHPGWGEYGEELDTFFKKYFGEMEGEQLKTTPRDFPADHPFIELLRYKSFLAVHKLQDRDTMSENFLKSSTEIFKTLKPFDDFLNKSLD